MSGSNLFTGTLDLLILRTLRSEAMHGYGIGRWIRKISKDVLQVEEGVLYPALHRLESKGLLKSSWGKTETGRRARFYAITQTGTKQLDAEASRWDEHAQAVAAVLETPPG